MLNDINTQPPQSGGMPIVGRPIINANVNVTNRIESDDLRKIMMDTFDDIATVLSDHCGPCQPLRHSGGPGGNDPRELL